MTRRTVSACLIVKDEEKRLPAALASVAFCDEIIVVDGGSRDRTVELAAAVGARVIENPWPGFASQRNVAIDHAAGDWILELDADERLTPALQREVEAFLSDPGEVDMAALPLRNRFLGRSLGPSTRYPVYRTRLFLRGAYRHDESRTVHEGLWSNGAVHGFEGDLEHILADSVAEAIGDWFAYARLEATMVPVPTSARTYAVGIVIRPMVKAAYRTFLLGGWRDGWRGLLRIALDCSSDALVWLHVAVRREPDAPRGAELAHFGNRHTPQGPVRVAAVAAGEADVRAAAAWLRAARAEGADVALIADRLPAASDLRVRVLGHLGPLALMRAIDAENQLRSIDALLAWGPWPRALVRLLSRGRRALLAPALAPSTEPGEAVVRVARATRPAASAYAEPRMERSRR